MAKLSVTLLEDFRQSAQSSSISTAIFLYEDVLSSQSPTNPKRVPTLFNLSDALVMQFHLTGNINDLDEGISHLQEAIRLPLVPVPERIRCLISLAASVCLRFYQTNDLQDMLWACHLFRDAHKEDIEAHKAFSHGTHLVSIFRQSGVLEDLERGVEYLYTSLGLRSAPHPHRSSSLGELANALWTRFGQKGGINFTPP
jgi:hypothetical protein